MHKKILSLKIRRLSLATRVKDVNLTYFLFSFLVNGRTESTRMDFRR
jgi:hypothetical protein